MKRINLDEEWGRGCKDGESFLVGCKQRGIALEPAATWAFSQTHISLGDPPVLYAVGPGNFSLDETAEVGMFTRAAASVGFLPLTVDEAIIYIWTLPALGCESEVRIPLVFAPEVRGVLHVGPSADDAYERLITLHTSDEHLVGPEQNWVLSRAS